METKIADTTEEQQTNWFKYAVWTAVVILIIFLGLGMRDAKAPQPIQGSVAPDMQLKFFEGYEWNGQREMMLSDLQGQVVVLNFWASWCVPCQEEARDLQAVSQEYKDDGVVFVGIAWTDTEKNSHEFLEQYGVTYPNAPDLQLKGSDAYRITGIPETFIIGKDGIVRQFFASATTESNLRSMLDEILQE